MDYNTLNINIDSNKCWGVSWNSGKGKQCGYKKKNGDYCKTHQNVECRPCGDIYNVVDRPLLGKDKNPHDWKNVKKSVNEISDNLSNNSIDEMLIVESGDLGNIDTDISENGDKKEVEEVEEVLDYIISNIEKDDTEMNDLIHRLKNINKENNIHEEIDKCMNGEEINECVLMDDIKTEIANDSINVDNSYEELSSYYDNVLNKDKTTYKSSNDEPTPIPCVKEMIDKLPIELWEKKDLKILDPCCGNGNFFIPIYDKLNKKYSQEDILKMFHFNDINKSRINNVKDIFKNDTHKLNITMEDFLEFDESETFDLMTVNPPYAKLLENGKRASKNHNMIKEFINKTLKLLNDGGYLLYITPDNWMSKSDRNTLINELTKYQIIHLNIHKAKEYFPKIGSSFTWYIIQKKPYYKNINIEGIWNGQIYSSSVTSRERSFIPQYYTSEIDSICLKTLESDNMKFKVETTSDLHKYTKRDLISKDEDNVHKYKLIHTPKQTVYASRPHKWQKGYKLFISVTDAYHTFIDNCGMTQSIAFIRCNNKKEAETYKKILDHDLYKFLNNICRWGNFNNIRILQSFPIPEDKKNIWNNFNLTTEEIQFIKDNV
jgi:adenine-specific DNA-methyltransferase